MFQFIKQALNALLCLGGSLATKCISLNNEPWITRPMFIVRIPMILVFIRL